MRSRLRVHFASNNSDDVAALSVTRAAVKCGVVLQRGVLCQRTRGECRYHQHKGRSGADHESKVATAIAGVENSTTVQPNNSYLNLVFESQESEPMRHPFDNSSSPENSFRARKRPLLPSGAQFNKRAATPSSLRTITSPGASRSSF
mmetsp:Transcript_44700/g.87566  ORF Transcript_44700/g.87566 Transcript_44700/m.87566 type:complete len:147 (+) Transcript_44700:836-1276(+)